MQAQQRIDLPTIAGIALLLMPLLTMAHELGGHAAACLALGGWPRQLGAFYIECDAPTEIARRLVAAAGPGIDIVIGLVGFRVWRRLRSDLARLIGWYVWLGGAFSAAGYFLFSGLSGIGDLGPQGHGGIGPFPLAGLWRLVFALGGGLAYAMLVRAGIRTLGEMLGTGDMTRDAKRRIAHGFYIILCLAALLASLPNPVGLFITLASAVAASFGGKAGFISIGYAPGRIEAPRPFTIARNLPLILAGLAMTLAFAAILGPTIHLPPAQVSGAAP